MAAHREKLTRCITSRAPRITLLAICFFVAAAILFNRGYFDRSQPPRSHPFQASTPMSAKKTATVIFTHGFPDAPIQPVTLNMGAKMPSWFDIIELDPDAKEDENGLLASVKTIQSLVQKEVAAGIPSNRIVLGGFSQGGVIAILTGLISPTPLAGVACLSGFLPLTSKIKELQGPHASSLNVFWGHGTDDPVVRYAWGMKSVDFLRQNLGVSNLEFKSYPGLVHSASPLELRNLLDWLKTHISNQ